MRHRLLTPLLIAALAPALTLAGSRADHFQALHGTRTDTTVVQVHADPAALTREGFDLARHGSDEPGAPVDVVADAAARERLVAMGLHFDEPKAASAPSVQGWSDFDEVMQRVDALLEAHPDLLAREELGTSIEGRPLVAIRISDAPEASDPARPKVTINANHHAREVMTVEAALDVVTELVEGYRAEDPDVVRWLSELEVWVTPVVNPDGYAFVHSDNTWWRKNRRDNGDGSHGVDLNRNYPYAWGANDSGSSGRPWSDTYRGAGPASEPEAAAMVALARRLHPVANLSYHSYGEVVLYPYGYENAVNPTGDAIAAVASEYARRCRQDDDDGHFSKRSRLYPVNGLDRDWYYFELGTYSFVPEISNSSRGFHPSPSWIQPTVEGLRPGWRYLLDVAAGRGVRGQVTDAVTGEPVPATVTLAEVQWKNDEPRQVTAEGFFHKVLAEAGEVHLEVSAEGYASQTVAVHVEDGLVRQDVALDPL